MLYSKLFGKTEKKAPNDATAISHKLLHQSGYIRELSAGRYEILPLGMRVFQKVINLIDKEMENIGSQRFSIPLLQPIEFWKKSNRDKAWGSSLMKIKDRNDSEFALSATGEGVVTEMVKETKPSYKDLPIVVHQFIAKFRDEMRPRGGLLRVREFVMKDAYSFHTTEEDFMKTYDDFYKAYSTICEKLELEYYPCIADSGALGGDYCHEFQIPCEAGEDKIAKCDSCDYAANLEKAEFIRDINNQGEVEPYEVVNLPVEVAKIKELVKHYGLPENRFIKNVVYKTKKGKLVIATVTGNLAVNDFKLAKAVGEDELEIATDEDLASIGAKSGFVHSWGYEDHKDKIIFVVDESVVMSKNLYGGLKTETTDPINVNYGRDFKSDIEADIADPYEGATCKKCEKGKIKIIRTIEFGHIFKYDHFYTEHHDGFFTDKDGQEKLMYMGAYGIGIERAMAVVVESHNDAKGIVWPENIAPFKVHLVGLNQEDEIVRTRANEVYKELEIAGIDVLFDDRIETQAGEKFSDADLIGNPWRVVVSRKSGDQVEVKKRNSQESKLISIEELIKELKG
ncbi:MAG: proline--tRNA ligase [Candidatus Dojkabacteria bacterium]